MVSAPKENTAKQGDRMEEGRGVLLGELWRGT